MTFKNKYRSIGKKEDFFTKYENNEKVTDESQQVQASITEMAKRYGIDALINKAKQTNIDNLYSLQNILYGNDLTKGHKSMEDLLKTKNKIKETFDMIPAAIRKEMFKDNPIEFINAYTSNDESKIRELNKVGLVSQTQYENFMNKQNELKKVKKEQLLKQQFIEKLETMKEGLYENFKTTGTIDINSIQGNSGNNKNV